MKKILFSFIVSCMTFSLFAQDYMDNIVNKSCECLTKIDASKTENIEMELGLCMISTSTNYAKELKRDYNIDMNKIDTQGEELGRIIGMKMVSVCPDALMLLAEKMNSDDQIENKNTFEGKIINISETNFVEFTAKDASGKISKFYWLYFVDSNTELSYDYNTLKNKTVEIIYSKEEFFDPRIGEYKLFNVIKTLNKK